MQITCIVTHDISVKNILKINCKKCSLIFVCHYMSIDETRGNGMALDP